MKHLIFGATIVQSYIHLLIACNCVIVQTYIETTSQVDSVAVLTSVLRKLVVFLKGSTLTTLHAYILRYTVFFWKL